jgi:AraC-like DNA-binding protein
MIKSHPDLFYGEVRGVVGPSDARTPIQPIVMVSNVTKGGLLSAPAEGLWLRYVGRGFEDYRMKDRAYRLGEDQVMVTPQRHGAEAEIRRVERDGTLGLCVYLPDPELAPELVDLDTPIVLPANCLSLGAAMRTSLKSLLRAPHKGREAAAVKQTLEQLLPQASAIIWKQIDALEGKRDWSRLEAFRKVNLARAYLNHVVDRPVPLDELARVSGVSRFHLLRLFRSAFGVTPSVYHRRLRVTLARQFAKERKITFAAAADRFGFAGGSSFSHAHRRALGTNPRAV